MSSSKSKKMQISSKTAITLAVLAASGILGTAAYSGLSALYTPPKEAVRPEPFLEVETVVLRPESHTMHLRGWGEAKSIEMLPISSKVPGEVLEVHPQLRMGNVIPEGETLVRIDDADLRILKAQAESQVRQAETAIARMKSQYEMDSQRLNTVRRSMELARSEFEKDKALLEERNIGSQSTVNAAELNYNQVRDAYDQVKNALALFPNMLEEVETGLEAARLQLEKVELELSRTVIKAPYTGRVKLVQVEVGQTIGPGMPLVIFSNDSELEISVALDSMDAREWLRFKESPGPATAAWFGEVVPVPCTVYWTEDRERSVWRGVLSRVERFDQMTRTVTVSVRVSSEQAAASGNGLPLVEGMFCEVDIEGKTLEDVYILPRWAVTFEGEAFIAAYNHEANEYRLQRAQVEVLGHYGDHAVIRNTLEPGTQVVVTKLHNPVRNSLLRVKGHEPGSTVAHAGESKG